MINKMEIIYKIVCKDLSINHCYVGHTKSLNIRRQSHKNRCNNVKSKKYNYKVYQTIRANGGWENWNIIEIEQCPTEDGSIRERYWYDLLEADLNSCVPNQSGAESQSHYYQTNKEEINKPIQCECGSMILRRNISRHHKTDKHLEKINSNAFGLSKVTLLK